MHQFYFPDLSAPQLQLSEEESKHAVRVLRLQPGDEVELADGRGTKARAVVADNHPKRCLLDVVSREQFGTGRQFSLHLAVAPTKNSDRIEWLVEKATELGIDAITLLHCEHSERSTFRTDRLEKIAVAAMKQSQQAWMPVIAGPVGFDEFLRSIATDTSAFIAHCVNDGERVPLNKAAKPGGNAVVLIGPEGDFSAAEIEAALNVGAVPVTLGNTRLRTETAALVACAAVHFVNAD
ncbi:MAG: 16S rRNA (uracil(1498)-N(3))-methyltransferase [Bacteroidia bacterium]|jgi:16S rRNA (uracil1498-N3)-methyltransferase|nr:16S rRNA (uracil(1498)-N(3))-methyltransferase [Bacteroidia bacterium]